MTPPIVTEDFKFWAQCPHCHRKAEIPPNEAGVPLNMMWSTHTIRNMLAHIKSNHPDLKRLVGIVIETITR